MIRFFSALGLLLTLCFPLRASVISSEAADRKPCKQEIRQLFQAWKQNTFNFLNVPPFLGRPPFSLFLDPLLGINQLRFLHDQIHSDPIQDEIENRVLRVLNVEVSISNLHRSSIPSSGPLVVVANHPLGLIEPFGLLQVIRKYRKDIKVLSTKAVQGLAHDSDSFIYVDNVSANSSSDENRRAFLAAARWLRNDQGVLIVFPAGSVSRMNEQGEIADLEWKQNVSRMIQMTKSPVLPVFVHGQNRPSFYRLGRLHDSLHFLQLIREFFAQRNTALRLTAGPLIHPGLYSPMSEERLTEALRESVYVLGDAENVESEKALSEERSALAQREDPNVLRAEIDRISQQPGRLLYSNSERYQVILMRGSESEEILREIGVLREEVFRSVGEGTGRSRDLDDYDSRYDHLILWKAGENRIAGAYRLAGSDRITSQDLYSSQFFNLHLLPDEPILELGRAFVVPEDKGALTYLWYGVGRYLIANPRYRKLMGIVSISQEMNPYTQRLIIEFLRRQQIPRSSPPLASARPEYQLTDDNFSWTFIDSALSGVRSFRDLERLVQQIESENLPSIPFPVLVRYYGELLAGEFVDFTIDPHFNSIDALYVVQIPESPRAVTRRFMGDQADHYFNWTP